MKPGELPVILLAAGASRRMRGRDKLLEQVDGTPLLRVQAQKALAISNLVIVTLPPAPHPRYGALDGLPVHTVEVPDAAEGMSVSLRRAFASLPADASAAMLLLGDLPDLTTNDLKKVAEAVDTQSDTLIWRGVTSEGAPGHPIVFDAALFPAFANLTGDTGGREVVAQAKGRITPVPLPGNRARHDLDTPEDWAAWRIKNAT